MTVPHPTDSASGPTEEIPMVPVQALLEMAKGLPQTPSMARFLALLGTKTTVPREAFEAALEIL